MTATAIKSSRARTGGPRNTNKIVEHIAGWTFVVVLAMLVTQTGLM
ncbi:SCO1431 family membrane protein [Streptomyces beijiangensis]|uniref:SCO1431 family membrane protein n=1 Tax=Streptomyces beijiangensis TaxID=163361 RepID=A0A939FAR2_9ACTN|nr:SCO1431 family membrane protein [Streptomyces beijiangensis]MBO0515167.1 SCO1431 family membrane protein [Streptomyces beijiangensis]